MLLWRGGGGGVVEEKWRTAPPPTLLFSSQPSGSSLSLPHLLKGVLGGPNLHRGRLQRRWPGSSPVADLRPSRHPLPRSSEGTEAAKEGRRERTRRRAGDGFPSVRLRSARGCRLKRTWAGLKRLRETVSGRQPLRGPGSARSPSDVSTASSRQPRPLSPPTPPDKLGARARPTVSCACDRLTVFIFIFK